MKVLIIAGGYGTRLWPITKNNPKALLPFKNGVILDEIIKKVDELGLITYISTNAFFAKSFEGWAKDKNVKILVEDTLHEGEKLGSIGALEEVMNELGVDDYLIIAGDNIFSFSLKDFLGEYTGKTLIAVHDVDNFELAKRYGVVIVKNVKIIEFEEKPENPKSTLVSTGVYLLPKDVMKRLGEYLTEGNRDSPGYLLQWLIEKGIESHAYSFNGYWYDIGSYDSYINAIRETMENQIEEEVDNNSKIIPPVVIKKGVKIHNSTVGPYVHIEENSTVEDSTITDSIIFKDTVINKSSITHSIIDKNCTIKDISLKESLLGGYSKIKK